jgi:CubicO group peptidase (beta-lactamase class C family)
MKNIILHFSFIMFAFFASAQDHKVFYRDDPKVKQIIAEFEKELNKNIANDTTGSISAVIFKGDEIIWSKAFGKSNNQKGLNADTNTVYRIGSTSKTITAYLMMLMVQNGTIHLDDPVAKYLPDLSQFKQDSWKNITFRELADHTSGLAREPRGLDTAAAGRTEEWENTVLKFIPITTLRPPIGKYYSYSNIGYALLGLAISRAAHKSFIDLVKEMVFRPHGMTNSFYIIPNGYENRIATGYQWDPSSYSYSTTEPERQLIGRSYKVPNGGVFTTGNDLARFVIALTADTDFLAKNYRDTMQTIQTFINKKKNIGYGLGLFITDDTKGVKMCGHDGGIVGYNSFMVFNPESRIGVILFRNCDNASPILSREGNILLIRLVKANKEM